MLTSVLIVCLAAIMIGEGGLSSEPNAPGATDINEGHKQSDDSNLRSGFGAPWLAWTEGPCSVSCGLGVLHRTRNCSIDDPQTAAENCIGPNKEADLCQEVVCPVTDGGWSIWVSSTCSVTCGHGMKSETRNCSNPQPAGSGKLCDGPAHRNVTCLMADCPVNGGWTNWTVNQCSIDCGVGIAIKTRNCSNPPPKNGGSECHGPDEDMIKCLQSNCPVDGEWALWTVSKSCVSAYGCHGMKTRTRRCNNPEPRYGGRWCQGDDIELLTCRVGQNQESYNCTGSNQVWLSDAGICTYISTDKKNQVDAMSACNKMCGRLIFIKNTAMFQEVKGHLSSNTIYWIDGSDAAHEGNWIHSDGSAVWAAWAPGRPGGVTSNNCLDIYSGSYYDGTCTGTGRYICEIMTG